MLRVPTQLKLEAVDHALRRAAQHHQASVIASTHVGQHIPQPGEDAFVFPVCHAELYAGLLGADIRMAAFLPCRVAAHTEQGSVVLESLSPLEFCRILNRPDLAPLAAPLEDLLRLIMEEAAAPVAEAVRATVGVHRGGLGATEEQVNARGSIPQRIDKRGTKVEELAGTGTHDAQGG